MKNILLAGFGGQGILFAGKQLAVAGMELDKNISWLPSYGPEMRGGTANCSVIISDEPIGSPLVTKPDILIAMNTPSYDKFIDKVVENGCVIADSSLINSRTERKDISAYYIPATVMASDNNLDGLANVIILGYLMKITGLFDIEYFDNILTGETAKKKPLLAEKNKQALYLGYNYTYEG